MTKLKGKVAIITGADSAIGRAAALAMAGEGADIVINYLHIAPGMVLTPVNQQAIDDPDYRNEQVQNIPMKRAAQPAEIGHLAVFLASDDASYVTGASYVMDGGLMQMSGQGA